MMMARPDYSREQDGVSLLLVLLALCLVLLSFWCTGCTAIEKLPPGAQMQSSTFGIKVSPQALDGAPLTLGSHTTIITTSQPADAGANLNRFAGAAPGVEVRSTVATGPVGEQIDAAGGPEALRQLMSTAADDGASAGADLATELGTPSREPPVSE